jgi:hypothetical protein
MRVNQTVRPATLAPRTNPGKGRKKNPVIRKVGESCPRFVHLSLLRVAAVLSGSELGVVLGLGFCWWTASEAV